MIATLLGTIGLLGYGYSAICLSRPLFGGRATSPQLLQATALVAVGAHAAMLLLLFSLRTWNQLPMSWYLPSLLLLPAAALTFNSRFERLRLPVFSLCAMGLLASVFAPSAASTATMSPRLASHVLLSVLAYGVLGIAGLQAALLAIQDRMLKSHRLDGLMEKLPPLETMETLLFKLIGIGLTLLTLSIATALVFFDNILQTALINKTLLTFSAWILFSILLSGRWFWGWRGTAVVRGTLLGFAALALAYFGNSLLLSLFFDQS